MSSDTPYYRHDLALIHHLGFAFHADDCAPGILALLEDVLRNKGLVVELGCGSGRLTRYLVDAGHRVIATDASPAMLEIAGEYVRGALSIEELVLPDDPIPEADAIVSVGHVLNYLPDEPARGPGTSEHRRGADTRWADGYRSVRPFVRGGR